MWVHNVDGLSIFTAILATQDTEFQNIQSYYLNKNVKLPGPDSQLKAIWFCDGHLSSIISFVQEDSLKFDNYDINFSETKIGKNGENDES
jgi:hypothetical protein